LGYGARVHVDPTKTAVAVQQHRFRGGLWIGGAILPLVLGIGGLAFVLVTLFDPHNPVHRTGDYALLACCGFFGFVMPFVAAGGAFLAALREMRRGEAIEALLACMREGRVLDREGLVSLVGKARADRAVIDALALGALTADPPAPPAPAAAVPAAPQVSAPHTPGFAPTMAQNSVRPPHAAQGVASPAHTPGPVLAAPLPVAWAPSASPAHVPPTAIGAHAMPAPRPSPVAGALTPERNSAEQLVGRTLKQTWFVEGLLAAGGMGCVYTARHVRTGKRYAVKTLLPDERISMESLHRFEREARTASSLGHVGIVQVHDFDLEGEPRFLVMDLLEGETLEQRLARVGRLGWQDARRIALEVADALAAAHQAGVLHRDLKPSNVFLARKEGLGERAVLLDFGLTKPIREGASVWVTRTGAIVGTAHYMSPEQARGERGLDQRADVYGLGALIYEMVAGIPPFLGATPFAVLTSLLTEAPVPPSHLMQGIPPALDALVLRALAKQPHERPADVPAMMRELAAL
jgi:tRNA A-37 threonylcarbamoyl transferase component Bud32